MSNKYIAVTNLNETPEILSGGDATSLNFDVQENTQVSTIVASDPDGCDRVFHSWTKWLFKIRN